VEVVALSTDSRFLPPQEAQARVAATLDALAAWAGVTWYKKIDSTLRGNLGAELEAMLSALPDTVAVICPTFPAQRRGLEGGNLVYAGAPPRHLPAVLREQSQLPVGDVELATVRRGRDVLAGALAELGGQGIRLLVVDALTEADLDTIVAATDAPGFLLCGSAGLVAPLAARWAQIADAAPKATVVANGPILALVGSGSVAAHTQVAQVARAEAMRVRALDNGWYEMDLAGAQSHPVGDWLLHLAQPAPDTALEGPLARAQAARLADVACAAVENLQPSTLLVVGGDTAYYVLRRLGIARLTVREELLPGIALTEGVDRDGQRRAVILKPGNFGDAQTLLTLQAAVRQRQQ
jgi:uncharacterized protein YgbK (DUF1537 family)